jgi:isocitrate dehydrogenase kinase/phosphatase
MGKQPKILILDVETAPILAAVWKLWDNSVGLNMIQEDWFIMSFAAKWMGSDDVIYRDCRKSYEDDRQLLVELHMLLSEADFVVAHNGDKFDIKKINARLIMNGFPPPAPYKTIDTLKIAKKHFAFTSNKLEYLTGELCEDKKLSHGKFPGYNLWRECLLGNKEAWEEMKEYNIMDVISLEELYIKLRPWYSVHPLVFTPEEPEDYICPKCGGTHVQKRGSYVSKTGIKYQRFQCQSCFGWGKGRYAQGDREQKELMPTSL